MPLVLLFFNHRHALLWFLKDFKTMQKITLQSNMSSLTPFLKRDQTPADHPSVYRSSEHRESWKRALESGSSSRGWGETLTCPPCCAVWRDHRLLRWIFCLYHSFSLNHLRVNWKHLCLPSNSGVISWDHRLIVVQSLSPVLHCLPEFAQIHVHWVSDAI